MPRRTVRRPLDESDAQFLLELLDLRRQGRLADETRLGGAAEVPVLGESDEVAQVAQVHWGHHRSRKTIEIIPSINLSDEAGAPIFAVVLGILDAKEGVAKRATFLVNPEGFIRFAYVTESSVGRNPAEVLRVLDALQTDELCPCN
jgi:alkyl hydroperoxide reductase subunit AhpC